MTDAENRLEANININKFPTNQTRFYHLDKTQDWLASILKELNEKVSDKSEDSKLSETTIECELSITKKQKSHMGNYLVVKGYFKANFLTECVRTLEEMRDTVETEIKACFVPKYLETEESFQDQTEVFEDDQMLELYFYEKGDVQLAEMIHEQVYLNVNQYPVLDPDAELAWGNDGGSNKH